MFAVRPFVKLVLLVWSLSIPCSAPQSPPKPSPETPAASMLPEVRLRKLHLVRPDLIPYPIAYEVFC
jgi:hypothetical protein